MKKIAIILSILCFAPAAFAGGTILYSPTSASSATRPMDPNATYVTQNSSNNSQEVTVSSKTEKTRKLRIGTQRNDPNSYWNFGRVNFGSGFSSEGSSTKRF